LPYVYAAELAGEGTQHVIKSKDHIRVVKALEATLAEAEQAFDGQMIRANVLSRDNDALRAENEAMKAVLSEAGITVEKVDGGYRWKRTPAPVERKGEE